MIERLCVTCPVLRGEPRVYDRPMVCDGCRARLRGLLTDIEQTYARLDPAGEAVNAGEWTGFTWVQHNAKGVPLRTRSDHWDPVALDAPAGPLAGRALDAIGNGPSEAQAPSNLDIVDLTMPARVLRLTDHAHRGDQTGHLPAAFWLDQWTRNWQEQRNMRETLPAPTVETLTRWLSDRLEWACDRHPAVDDFASEMAELDRVLRRVAGLNPATAEVKLGVPCRNRECDRVGLYQWPGSDRVECPSCPSLLSVAEYQQWCQTVTGGLLAGWVKARRRAPVCAR